MLIIKEVEVVLNGTTIKYFESLGYKIPRYKDKSYRIKIKNGTKLLVKIEDLQPQSNVYIELQCDYCGTKYSSRYQDYYKYNINGNIHKDACGKCSHLKSAEANLLLYGVSNSQKRPEVREKFKNSCFEKYGKTSFLESSDFERGVKETHWNWKGGITSEEKLIRDSNEYKEWRINVFKRDNYACLNCGDKGGKLQAHHLENFSSNLDLRFDINNGVTLCFKCHSPKMHGSFHNIYGLKNNTLEQFEEYKIRYRLGEFKEILEAKFA